MTSTRSSGGRPSGSTPSSPTASAYASSRCWSSAERSPPSPLSPTHAAAASDRPSQASCASSLRRRSRRNGVAQYQRSSGAPSSSAVEKWTERGRDLLPRQPDHRCSLGTASPAASDSRELPWVGELRQRRTRVEEREHGHADEPALGPGEAQQRADLLPLLRGVAPSATGHHAALRLVAHKDATAFGTTVHAEKTSRFVKPASFGSSNGAPDS